MLAYSTQRLSFSLRPTCGQKMSGEPNLAAMTSNGGTRIRVVGTLAQWSVNPQNDLIAFMTLPNT